MLNLFDSKSCVVFVSLAEKFACVTKATNGTEALLGYRFTQLKDKTVNQIIPLSIAAIHDNILHNFVKKSTEGYYFF
jgi:hypothetical protein